MANSAKATINNIINSPTGRQFREIIFVVALILPLLVLLDYLCAGNITVKNVDLQAYTKQQNLIITLPHTSRLGKTNQQYHFKFSLSSGFIDKFRPLTIIGNDCINRLNINGNKIIIPPDKICDRQGFPIDSNVISRGPNDFEVSIEDNVRGNFAFILKYERLLTSAQSTWIIIGSIYLLCLAWVDNLKTFSRLHRNLFIIFVFLYTWAPKNSYSVWNPGTIWGIIFFIALMALIWKPTRIITTHLGLLTSRIYSIPPRIFVSCSVLLFFLLTGYLSQHLFDGIPHVADTHIQYVHAKIIAQGKLYEISHPLKDFFNYWNNINDGKFYATTFPGHVFLLAIGHLVGFPWLINPLMGALTLIPLFLLGREVGGKSVGYISICLMLISPYIIFLSSEYMAHTTCIFFLTFFLYCYIHMVKSGDNRFAILAGLCLGYAFITRVQSAVPYAIPVALHALWLIMNNPRKNIVRMLTIAGSFSVFVLYLLYYNYATTGSPWLTAYEKFAPDVSNHITKFFTLAGWLTIDKDLARAVWQSSWFHRELFSWPISSFIFVAILFLLRLQSKYSSLLIACALAQFVSLIFVYGVTGSVFEPRYLYECSAALIILTAMCLRKLPKVMWVYSNRILPLPAYKGTVFLTIIMLFGLAFPYHTTDLYRLYKNHYWEGNYSYYKMFMDTVEKPAVVFVKPYTSYRKLFFTMPPYDENPVIFALDVGVEANNKKLMDYYPNRHIYMADDWNVVKIR